MKWLSNLFNKKSPQPKARKFWVKYTCKQCSHQLTLDDVIYSECCPYCGYLPPGMSLKYDKIAVNE